MYAKDHFENYAKPEIALHLVSDQEGRDFLLLNGPEPSFQWERLAASVDHVLGQLGVQHTVLVQSIPAPAPHTRPVAVTSYATDPALVEDEDSMLGTFTFRASFPSVLTLRLGEAGHPVTGLLAHVPHYVADGDYPAAAAALWDKLRATTKLSLPTGGFDLANGLMRAQIDQQVAASEELTAMVSVLEANYEQFMSERVMRTTNNAQLPSAEEIGRQFEDFLAGLGEGPGATTNEADPPGQSDAPEDHADPGEG